MKVWRIISGPYHRDDVEDSEVPEGLEYMLVTLTETDGELEDQEFWFGSWDEVQQWVMHFKSKIDPIIVNDDDLYVDAGEN